MVNQASLTTDLAGTLGEFAVSQPDSRHGVDGVAPEAVAAPADYDEVSRLLRYAGENHLAVIPLGGAVHAGLGNLPERYDIAMEMRRISGIVEFEPADLTITVRAGTTLGELRKITRAKGLMVPFDPSIPDRASVGGILAANVSGPARMSMGRSRDFTIGMRVVTADGRLTRAGGRVVKNVAGYDMCKLYIGSLGTLAVIVEATFKTVPSPTKRMALAFDFADPAAACRVVSDAVRRGLKVQSARLTSGEQAWRLHVELAGTPEAVARSEFDIAAGTSAGGGKQVTPSAAKHRPRPFVVRVTTIPGWLPALLCDAATPVPEARIDAQPWDGVCRLETAASTDLSAIRELAGRHRATFVVERCPPELKREIDVFGEMPPGFILMQRIKQEFDPGRVLSPGRYVGRL